jgi:hypothetical protein
MKKNSLATTGLSLSQAQSISNLCNQRAQDINAKLNGINNAEKIVTLQGVKYIETAGKKIPTDVVELIKNKALLHSTQAFLMENIKAKDDLLKSLQRKEFVTALVFPDYPELSRPTLKGLVSEDWGWEQLSISEYNEYLECEAYASHIGQFIHKSGVLDNLRRTLPTVKNLEWIEVKKDEKTPLVVNVHHTSEQLLTIHEELATLHRQHEQRVNYFKAKVKNLVTEENARIARENGDLQAVANNTNKKLLEEYKLAYSAVQDNVLKEQQEFESSRQEEIKAVASLRINVDIRFQSVIDEFLSQLGK